MSLFQPPPTYASPVDIDEKTGKPAFSSVWLRWFLDLVAFISNSGGAGGGAATHNSLAGLQGGAANQFYHLTQGEHDALTGVAGTATPLAITLGAGRLQVHQGAAVTAANNLSLGTDGNYFQVSGATQINLLDSTSWQGGSIVRLKFNSTPTVKHNQAASGAFKPIILNAAADLVAAAKNTLSLVYDSTDTAWYEVGRKV